MKYVHLVVHHGINSLLHDVHGYVVPGGVHQQPTHFEKRGILNRDRKSSEMTFIVLCVASEGLQESLKTTHKSNIMLS